MHRPTPVPCNNHRGISVGAAESCSPRFLRVPRMLNAATCIRYARGDIIIRRGLLASGSSGAVYGRRPSARSLVTKKEITRAELYTKPREGVEGLLGCMARVYRVAVQEREEPRDEQGQVARPPHRPQHGCCVRRACVRQPTCGRALAETTTEKSRTLQGRKFMWTGTQRQDNDWKKNG